jgi:hypothetical protein
MDADGRLARCLADLPLRRQPFERATVGRACGSATTRARRVPSGVPLMLTRKFRSPDGRVLRELRAGGSSRFLCGFAEVKFGHALPGSPSPPSCRSHPGRPCGAVWQTHEVICEVGINFSWDQNWIDGHIPLRWVCSRVVRQ